ncbi:MAG: aminotransferase class V-fold PLP-dependent enzyme [Defluviitaleaceae bacterium]|nr:aminotransferase class V-fold PLP-dependent enzyme [Defluviitaleaceae bacterium]
MKKIYVDNSATSYPKAPGVSDAMKYFLDNVGCNVNRGGYESAFNTGLEILKVRKMLCDMFNFNQPRNVVFTPGITYSLNMILWGFLRPGDHVITTSMEHNGLMRPLHDLSKNGVAYDVVQCGRDGSLNPKDVELAIKLDTRAVVMTHASNVCGTILPVGDVAEICARRGIKLIVDSAQTVGVLGIDMTHIDAMAFTCHKGLLAAPGLGGFVVKSDLAAQIKPIITGGTGSASHEIVQPELLPDKFESGTMNIPAIMGLKRALEYINSVGVDTIFAKEMALTEKFLMEINGFDGVEVIGKKSTEGRIAVVSLNFEDRDNAEIATVLDNEYGIMTRCGLHCAPGAHKTLGTYPHGTVRFSFGHFNTMDEIDRIVWAVKDILRGGVGRGF